MSSPDGNDLDLLAGEEMARFANDLRVAYAGPLRPDAERRLLAATIEVARLAIDKGDPAARPASKAHGPARNRRQASGPPKWRRRTVLSSLFASLTAKIAGVAVAAVAATGGLAAAGALPGPVQQAVSSAAAAIGVQLPTPAPAVTGTVGTPTGTVTGTTGDGQDVSGTTTDGGGVTSTVGGSVTGTVTGTVTGANHGNCVSYAAHLAGSLGFSGRDHGQFVSTVARDSSAISQPVTGTATPDAACMTAIDSAKASLGTGAGTGGGPVTGTVTPTVSPATKSHGNGNSHGKGKSSKG